MGLTSTSGSAPWGRRRWRGFGKGIAREADDGKDGKKKCWVGARRQQEVIPGAGRSSLDRSSGRTVLINAS